MTTKFHEMCDRCYSEMICECPECEDKDRLIEKLLGACNQAHHAIKSLDFGDLGVVEPDGTHEGYSIRDEILHGIATAIKEAE